MNKQNQKTVFMHGKEYKKTKVQCTNKLNIWLGYRQHEYNKGIQLLDGYITEAIKTQVESYYVKQTDICLLKMVKFSPSPVSQD